MNTETFKNNMATIRAMLKRSNSTKATVLCMAIAATRGHVHAAHIWQKLQVHCIQGKTVGTLEGQRAFITANAHDPWGAKPLSVEDLAMVLATIDAAEAWRANWAARGKEAREIAQEQPVLV